MSWAATEFKSLDLGDGRRNRRAIWLVGSPSVNSTVGILQAWGDWADTMAGREVVL